jgi:transposase
MGVGGGPTRSSTKTEHLNRTVRNSRFYDTEITRLDSRIADEFKDDEGYEVIQQLNGVGPVLASIFCAELGDVERFRSAKAVCSWARLTPSQRESDTTVHRGPITKQGSGLVRWRRPGRGEGMAKHTQSAAHRTGGIRCRKTATVNNPDPNDGTPSRSAASPETPPGRTSP